MSIAVLIITSLYPCSPGGSHFAMSHILIKENVFFCTTDTHPDLLAEVSSSPAAYKWVERGKVATDII